VDLAEPDLGWAEPDGGSADPGSCNAVGLSSARQIDRPGEGPGATELPGKPDSPGGVAAKNAVL